MLLYSHASLRVWTTFRILRQGHDFAISWPVRDDIIGMFTLLSIVIFPYSSFQLKDYLRLSHRKQV